MTSVDSASSPRLRRALGPASLWGLGVGYVISGEYFGWNLGLPLGGTYGMLAATLIVTVMYVTFILSYAELACAMPQAGGAFVYARRAFGPFWGFFAGLTQIIEFTFAPPAIAMAIAAYVSQRFPLDPVLIAILAYVLFSAINVWGVRQAAIFELVVTVLAVTELLVFIGITAPHFEWSAFSVDPLPNGISGVFACLPFAIWFYLAIEGVANAAEETRNPQRDVAIGFGSAMGTLVVLALAVFFCAVGVAGWHAVVYAPGQTSPSDAPLPLALAAVVGNSSWLYTMMLGVGLLGLVASFHGIIMVAARAWMELGRSGFGPKALSSIHPRTKTPVVALAVNAAVGIVAILSGKTAEIITLACFGAVSLYIVSMLALLALRVKEPELARPFRAIAYPYFPVIALVLAAFCLVALTWYNLGVAAVFGATMGAGAVVFVVRRKAVDSSASGGAS